MEKTMRRGVAPPELDLAFSAADQPSLPRTIGVISVVLVVVWALTWYWASTASMVRTWWRSETFAHGFVIVPIVLWLIWREREYLAHIEIRPSAWGVAGICCAGFGWLVADSASVLGGMQFMTVAMVPLAVWAILGFSMLRALAFPLAFLFFAIPFGEFVVPSLMDWTADFTIAALRATGIPVFREGNVFTIPSGKWSVVEACSGVRYLIASVVVGTLYAYLTYRSTLRRLTFIAVSIVVPLVANWLRAYMIVMIGHLSGNRLAVGVDHIIYGWVFFGVVMLLLFWAASAWRQDGVIASEPRALASKPAAPAPTSRIVFLTLLALAAVSVWKPLGAVVEANSLPGPVRLGSIPPANGWAVTELQPFRPDFAAPAAESMQAFGKNKARVGVFIAFYRNQSQSSELINQNNQLVTTINKSWTQVSSGDTHARLGDAPLRARTAEVIGAQRRLIAWQWYWIGGLLTTSDYLGKVYLAWMKLTGQGDDSAVVVIYTDEQDGAGSAGDVLRQFSSEMGPSVARLLEQASRP